MAQLPMRTTAQQCPTDWYNSLTSGAAEALASVRRDPLHGLLLSANLATSCLELRMP